MSYDPNEPPAFICIACGLILLTCIIGTCYAGYKQFRESREADRAEAVAQMLEAEFNAVNGN